MNEFEATDFHFTAGLQEVACCSLRIISIYMKMNQTYIGPVYLCWTFLGDIITLCISI